MLKALTALCALLASRVRCRSDFKLRLRCAALVLLPSLVPLSVSEAIIIRHDVAPGAYEARAADFPAVFYLERQGLRKVCVATVIHPRWAITAAHCAEQTLLGATVELGRRFGVTVANRAREIDAVIIHPDYDQRSASDVDLALLRFREAAAIPVPMPVNLRAEEQGQVVNLLGWGYSGRGLRGREFDDGRLRRAENRVIRADRRLRLRFDDPREGAGALPLEGTLGLGDSGGPALLATVTGPELAGIAIGEVEGVDFQEETQGKYGAITIFERISRHIDWLEAVIGMSAPFDS